MPGTFTYDPPNNRVSVTGGTAGSPADFPSWVAADRAGILTLRAAGAPGASVTLTTQIRPCELRALLISFVVASKTTEADYLFITGTDAWGNAQTESIDVSAGNGTYVSIKRWRTIGNIDCSDNPSGGGAVWANGTLAVTQPQWGTIWDKGNSQYQIDALVNVGDGVVSTYLADSLKQLSLSNIYTADWQAAFYIKANATVRLGELINATDKSTRKGCQIIASSPNYAVYLFRLQEPTGGLYLYSCTVGQLFTKRLTIYAPAGAGRLWNCHTSTELSSLPSSFDVHNVTITGQGTEIMRALQNLNATLNHVRVYDSQVLIELQGTFESLTYQNVTEKGTTWRSIYPYDFVGSAYLINCDLLWTIDYWGGTNNPGSIYRQHTLDLKVSDKNDNPISGAAVKIYDKDGNLAADLITGADGKIAQQRMNYKRYYWGGSATATQDYYPYHIVISKAGYETYEDKLNMDRKMDMEVGLADASLCFLRRR